MDATSIITQVSRDDEQLGTYGPEKGKTKKMDGWLIICSLVRSFKTSLIYKFRRYAYLTKLLK